MSEEKRALLGALFCTAAHLGRKTTRRHGQLVLAADVTHQFDAASHQRMGEAESRSCEREVPRPAAARSTTQAEEIWTPHASSI